MLYAEMFAVKVAVLAVLQALAGSLPVFADHAIDLTSIAEQARPAVMSVLVTRAHTRVLGTGAAFVIGSDGELITNWHVIKYASRVIVKNEHGASLLVRGVLAEDRKRDLAILKIDATDLPSLKLANPHTGKIGEPIAMIDNPMGFGGPLSDGIVSQWRRLLGNRMLQITPAAPPGSSGSPLLNAHAEVVGVASAQILFTERTKIINLAIPVEAVWDLLAKVKSPEIVRTFSEHPRRNFSP